MLIALVLHLLLGVPQCTTEDSTQSVCVWNAQTQGNHEGRSFLLVNGNVIYL